LLVVPVIVHAFLPSWHSQDGSMAPTLFLVNITGVSTITFLAIMSFFHHIRGTRSIMLKQTENMASSIRYAKSIQNASLPSHLNLTNNLGELLLLYSPKDIVSGDFYWTAHKNGRTIVAVADCTGHGVPGGFMTMLGINSLNNIVLEKGVTDPAMILHYLHWGIRDSFSRSSSPVTDGMDISVCSIDRARRTVTYSGAMSSLYHVNGALNVYPSGHTSIGEPVGTIDFSDRRLPLHEGDHYYMFSDGFTDQFGGEQDKRYGRKRMKELLVRIACEPMSRQQEIIEQEFNSWKGDREQIDDVLLLGFKI
jgi:serine phosphatase RsbU (regulator of sigma subunit)